jgi:hypothetical protein
MPLKECQENNKNGWKWGDSGKCYTGPGAKKKALKQGRAIETQKYSSGGEDLLGSACAFLELNELDKIADVEEQIEAASTTVQSLIFPKDKYKTAKECKDWAKKNNYKNNKVDETGDSFRLRQRDPGDFQPGSFRTIEFGKGIKAVIGKLK